MSAWVRDAEPYRVITKQLRARLKSTLDYLERCGGEPAIKPDNLLTDNEELWEPLYLCYRSLVECGMKIIANGQLLDTLRRIRCFGLQLVRIDVRQESTRHTEALSELTQYLGLGDCAAWPEEKNRNSCCVNSSQRRPLVLQNWECSNETREVFDTCG